VKEGDLLIELDTSALDDESMKQQIVVAEAQRDLQQAEASLKGLKAAGASQLSAAELAVKAALLNRERVLGEGGELAIQIADAQRRAAVAEQALKVATGILARRRQAVELGRTDSGELEEAQLGVVEAQAAMESARDAKRLLTKQTREYQTALLELAVVRAKTTFATAKIHAETAMVQAMAELESSRAAAALEERKSARLVEQIKHCRIVAPRDGLVIYAGTTRRGVAIEPGATVRDRQLLLTMPDVTRLQARVLVNETRINRVRKGQRVTLRIDAFPDRHFRGVVTEISQYPEPVGWLRSGVKEYAVVVSVENPARESQLGLRLGMTGEAEIDTSTRRDP